MLYFNNLEHRLIKPSLFDRTMLHQIGLTPACEDLSILLGSDPLICDDEARLADNSGFGDALMIDIEARQSINFKFSQ